MELILFPRQAVFAVMTVNIENVIFLTVGYTIYNIKDVLH